MIMLVAKIHKTETHLPTVYMAILSKQNFKIPRTTSRTCIFFEMVTIFVVMHNYLRLDLP